MFNLERSAFRPGEWVGYSYGMWRIHKSTSGYYASKLLPNSRDVDPAYKPLEARTLREMSAALAADEKMLQRLTALLVQHSPKTINIHGKSVMADYTLVARTDADALRRISMTLHNWHELECNADIRRGIIEPGSRGGFAERENGAPFLYKHEMGKGDRFHLIPDREAGALKRLKAIMARYPALQAYVQGDPRGCALYILRPGDVPEGADASAYYSRGLAVFK